MCLAEAIPKILYYKVPYIWLVPIEQSKLDTEKHVSSSLLTYCDIPFNRSTNVQCTKLQEELVRCQQLVTRLISCST